MNKRSMHGKLAGLLAVLLSLLCLCACGQADETETDYALASRWAYYETETDAEKPVDVFFIAPTNVQGGENEFYVDNLDDAQALEAILGSINMEKGIYDAQARFFAPYYRQLTLNAYTLDEAERLAYQDAAWQDVQDAFAYYLEHENNGRPFLIAGFSQGAELGLRLLKQYGGDAAFQEQLVAAYLIGWARDRGGFGRLPKPENGAGRGGYGRHHLLRMRSGVGDRYAGGARGHLYLRHQPPELENGFHPRRQGGKPRLCLSRIRRLYPGGDSAAVRRVS